MNQFNPNQVPQPQSQVPPAAPQPPQSGAPTPFEMPPQPQQSGPGMGFQPTGMEPPKEGGKSWILIVILLVILVLGGLVFASWEGWISLGPLDKYLGKTKTSTTPTPTPAAKASNDTIRKSDLTSIKDALKKYYQANQKYPVSSTVDKTSNANSVLKVLVPTYIAALPKDPVNTNYYGYKSDGITFELTAVLDDTTDTAGTKVGNYYLYKVTDTTVETPTTSNSSGSSKTPSTTTDTTTTTTTTDTGTATGSSSTSSNATSTTP